jgi:hypothetical protein
MASTNIAKGYVNVRQNGKSPKEAAAAADRYMEKK